jgi:hypothetical protein
MLLTGGAFSIIRTSFEVEAQGARDSVTSSSTLGLC